MQLIKMADYRSRDLVAVFKCLLARAERGELDGAELVIKPVKGVEEIVIAGAYRRDLARAGNAAMRLCVRLSQEQDDTDSELGVLPL